MYAINDVMQVRNNITQYVGQKVRLQTNKGRQKSLVSSGTIESVYPSVFTIMLDDSINGSGRTVSYSYTDVLTKSVQITVFES
ncbi:MAG: Veg family protein [Defluviitaleaceae bacterium]|nr:Veg family protein [Defluviitaleaceae bacterium]